MVAVNQYEIDLRYPILSNLCITRERGVLYAYYMRYRSCGNECLFSKIKHTPAAGKRGAYVVYLAEKMNVTPSKSVPIEHNYCNKHCNEQLLVESTDAVHKVHK